MALKLSQYKLSILKHICFLSGCAQGINKTVIQQQLTEHINRHHAYSRPIRIVSVDMGIRNLAYCVMTASRVDRLSNLDSSTPIHLDIDTWQKLDLTQQLKPQEIPSIGEALVSSSLFTPANVSKLAYNVSTKLLHHKPDVVLIEEQRHRSSSGSAIQEWTVRVNMLESMLWACLETMKNETAQSSFPSVYSVSPAKVAKFWYAGNTMDLSPSSSMLDGSSVIEGLPGRTKITKKDKIAVLQSWLTTTAHKDVQLKFSGEAQATAQRFMKGESRKRGETPPEKLDDLTDCLLQGASWVKWQENSGAISQMLKMRHE